MSLIKVKFFIGKFLNRYKTFYVFKTCFATLITIKEKYEFILYKICLKKEQKEYLGIK